MSSDPRVVPGWDCADGTAEEDHDWIYIPYRDEDPHYKRCRQCGKEIDLSGKTQ